MGVAWAGEAAGGQAADEFARAVRQTAPAASVILLSMSGFTKPVTGTDSGRTLLWDRTQLEAVVCGLVTLPDLLEASISAAFVGSVPYETLARLLAGSDRDACAGMATPDRLPSPWPVLEQPYDSIPARLALVGEDGWDKPSGIAALDTARLVVVTASGLAELDTARAGHHGSCGCPAAWTSRWCCQTDPCWPPVTARSYGSRTVGWRRWPAGSGGTCACWPARTASHGR
jgi:hypothetical protein